MDGRAKLTINLTREYANIGKHVIVKKLFGGDMASTAVANPLVHVEWVATLVLQVL